MTYLGELLRYRRALAAATLGVSAGALFLPYINNNLLPQMIAEFGWSAAAVSLTGITVLLPAVCMPFVGRLTDTFGVRRIAMVGVVATPLSFVAFSLMTGDFKQYFLLTALQVLILGTTVVPLVYSRLLAERFDRARGIALSIAACSPAVVGAISAPLLSEFIASHGWRAGYVAVAFWTGAVGAVALLLISNRGDDRQRVPNLAQPRAHLFRGYGAMFRSVPLQIILAAMLLVNLPIVIQGLQLKVILLERSMTTAGAAWLISLYASSVVAGRMVCGLALDRFPAHIVTAVALGLPALGLVTLGSGMEHSIVLAGAVALLGLALGAEADILPFLIMRYFSLDTYSSVLGVVTATCALSAALGAMLLSVILELNGSFNVFLMMCGCTTATGSLLLLRLEGRVRDSVAASVN